MKLELDEKTVFIRSVKYWDDGETRKDIVRVDDSTALVVSYILDEDKVWQEQSQSSIPYREDIWASALKNLLEVSLGTTSDFEVSDDLVERLVSLLHRGEARIGTRLYASNDAPQFAQWAESIGATTDIQVRINQKPVALFEDENLNLVPVLFESTNGVDLAALAAYSINTPDDNNFEYQLVRSQNGNYLVRGRTEISNVWITTNLGRLDEQEAFDSWVIKFRAQLMTIGFGRTPYILEDLDGEPSGRLERLIENYPNGVTVEYREPKSSSPSKTEQYADFRPEL
jgi:hypothetical protein